MLVFLLLLEIFDVSIFEFISFVQVHVEDAHLITQAQVPFEESHLITQAQVPVEEAHLIAQAQVPVEITENDEIKKDFINEKNKNN